MRAMTVRDVFMGGGALAFTTVPVVGTVVGMRAGEMTYEALARMHGSVACTAYSASVGLSALIRGRNPLVAMRQVETSVGMSSADWIAFDAELASYRKTK